MTTEKNESTGQGALRRLKSQFSEWDDWDDTVAIIALSTFNTAPAKETPRALYLRSQLIEAVGAYMQEVAPRDHGRGPTVWDRAKLFDLLSTPEAKMPAIGDVIQDILGFKYFAGSASLQDCVNEIEEIILNEREQLSKGAVVKGQSDGSHAS